MVLPCAVSSEQLEADSAFNLKHSGKCKTLSQNIAVRVP